MSPKNSYHDIPDLPCSVLKEQDVEDGFIATEQKLMMMRPYQVYAVQHMVKCIDDDNGNGFVWHTTGSGKTITSINASTLLKRNAHSFSPYLAA